MNILHIGNPAGVATYLAKAQTEMGDYAKVLDISNNYLQYPHDLENYYGSVLQRIIPMFRTYTIARGFDIIHVHGGLGRTRLDILLSKYVSRKNIIIHYHGSESRKGYGMHYQKIADAKIIATPDLFEWHPDANFIPNPFPPQPYDFSLDAKPCIIHMPTVRSGKGTSLIMQAIDELRDEGLDFEFKLIEKRSHKEAMAELKKAHILIDQVIDRKDTGIPSIMGVASIEAMSMGKVAITHFYTDIQRFYPGNPIITVQVNKEDLKEKIRRLIEDMDETKRIGEESREYVLSFHDPKRIAKTVRCLYENDARK